MEHADCAGEHRIQKCEDVRKGAANGKLIKCKAWRERSPEDT